MRLAAVSAHSARAVLLAIALVCGVFTAPARAQSESDLRRQNQELTTKVKDLEAELAAARKKADDLQKRITALEASLAARPAGGGKVIPPLEEEKVSIDESKPSASPRALRKAIEESYQKAMANLPMGKAGDRDRIAYMRALAKWEPATEREYRMPIDWHVRVQPASMLDSKRERIATFIAVDPVTGTRLGDEFDVALSRAIAGRLVELEARGELDMLILKGTVVPNIRINTTRESRGAFDNPLFVGPFAEYEFTVEPSSVTAYRPAATQPATMPATVTPAPAAPVPEK
jgi:hypothetical protein